MTLEESISYCAEDELIELTPKVGSIDYPSILLLADSSPLRTSVFESAPSTRRRGSVGETGMRDRTSPTSDFRLYASLRKESLAERDLFGRYVPARPGRESR